MDKESHCSASQHVFSLNEMGGRLIKLQQELNVLLQSHGISKVRIWGAGLNGRLIQQLLLKSSVEVLGFYDRCVDAPDINLPIQAEPNELEANVALIIAMDGPSEKVQEIATFCRSQGVCCIHACSSIVLSPMSKSPDGKSGGKGPVLKEYAGRYARRRCVMLGNGPSIGQDVLNRLDGEVVFACNRAYEHLDFDQLQPEALFWSFQDELVGTFGRHEWDKLPDRATLMIPEKLSRYFIGSGHEQCLLTCIQSCDAMTVPPFSNRAEMIFLGASTLFMQLQLAAIMGFESICLLGVDGVAHTISSIPTEWDGVFMATQGDTMNPLFPPGTFFKPFSMESQRLDFQSANSFMNLLGIRVVNAHQDSTVDVFPKVRLDQWLNGSMN